MKINNCVDCKKPIEPKKESEQWQSTGEWNACNDCFDYWGHENGHSDGGHETILLWLLKGWDLDPWMKGEVEEGRLRTCRVCKGRTNDPEIDTCSIEQPTKYSPETAEEAAEARGTKGWHSHKGHGHAFTQAARARCRRAQMKGAGIEGR